MTERVSRFKTGDCLAVFCDIIQDGRNTPQVNVILVRNQIMAQRILVVEDDQFLRELYDELLREEGYEVDLAPDGEIGLSKIINGGYELILLDIMLPKIDGLEILRRVKKQGTENPNGSTVLLTNLGQDSIIKEGFNLGASGYLIKSAMNPDQVLSEVKVFLNKSSSAIK